jgi:hypothetical protein
LFRLKPAEFGESRKPGKGRFQGYRILGQVRLEKAEQRKEVATFLGKALHWNILRQALCFNPRHGLRVVHDKRTLELVICFECNRIEVYEGGEIQETVTVLAEKHEVIERILRDAGKDPKPPS